MTRFVPFYGPGPNSKLPEKPELTESQLEKYNEVLEHFQTVTEFPVDAKSKETSALTDSEKAWLTKECFLRYLRATKWNVPHSLKRLEDTIVWRRGFGLDPETNLTPEQVSEEGLTGKQVVLGFDNDNRPCLYLKPGRQNTTASHRQVEHMVFMLERVIDFTPPGQDQCALIIDFKPVPDVGVSARHKMPSISIGREWLNILQNHYPERLGKALLTNIPRLAWIFLKLIRPFIDPNTYEKLVFEEPLDLYVPKDQLDQEVGGDLEFEYDHDQYFPAMNEMAAKKRANYMKNFYALGAQVGLSEVDLRKEVDESDGSSPLTLTDEKVGNGNLETDALADMLKGVDLDTKEETIDVN
jgi:hypothetical protein